MSMALRPQEIDQSVGSGRISKQENKDIQDLLKTRTHTRKLYKRLNPFLITKSRYMQGYEVTKVRQKGLQISHALIDKDVTKPPRVEIKPLMMRPFSAPGTRKNSNYKQV